MTDAELIERLRANSSWGDGRFAEAADRIEQLVATTEALTAERDDWKKRHFKMRDERDKQAIAAKNYADFNHKWRNRAEKAEADNARLRNALEPFAAKANGYDGIPSANWGDTSFVMRHYDNEEVSVTLGNLRKARAALTGKEPSHE